LINRTPKIIAMVYPHFSSGRRGEAKSTVILLLSSPT